MFAGSKNCQRWTCEVRQQCSPMRRIRNRRAANKKVAVTWRAADRALEFLDKMVPVAGGWGHSWWGSLGGRRWVDTGWLGSPTKAPQGERVLCLLFGASFGRLYNRATSLNELTCPLKDFAYSLLVKGDVNHERALKPVCHVY